MTFYFQKPNALMLKVAHFGNFDKIICYSVSPALQVIVKLSHVAFTLLSVDIPIFSFLLEPCHFLSIGIPLLIKLCVMLNECTGRVQVGWQVPIVLSQAHSLPTSVFIVSYYFHVPCLLLSLCFYEYLNKGFDFFSTNRVTLTLTMTFGNLQVQQH